MTVRTRFAPSPTGYLHIGGARTALYCWLYAKRHQGTFILRIEDTDKERSTEESVQAIFDGMDWLGLKPDEGPFYQTHRFERYKKVIQRLLEDGHVYRCYCSKERLDEVRNRQIAVKEKPRYDGHCRAGATSIVDNPYVIRFRMPLDGEVIVDDLIHGPVVFQNAELDDFIIARSDGTPTYNFTVVVDDWDMEISHVIRGDDHLNNTPKQINILQALGAKIPRYVHVPMILGEDHKRLSKRHGAASVMQYRDEGYLPEALLNYLVRLGWSHGDQEIFSMQELMDLFDVSDVNKSAAALNPEKLLWLNQHYLKTQEPNYVAEQLKWHLQEQNIAYTDSPSLVDIVKVQSERAKTLVEMADRSRYFYQDVNAYDEKAAKKNLKPEILIPLTAVRDQLAELNAWNDEALHDIVIAAAEQAGLKLGKLAQPIRVAVTGGTVSPPINATLRLLGKEKTIQRLDKALDYIKGLDTGS